MLLNFLQPRMQVDKGLSLEHVKHKYYSIGAPVICVRNCPVSFLPGGVPNLKFNLFLSVSDAAESLNDEGKGIHTKSTPIVEI